MTTIQFNRGARRWSAMLTAGCAAIFSGCRTAPPDAPPIPTPAPAPAPARPAAVRPFRVFSYMPHYALRQMRDLDGLGPDWFDRIRLDGVEVLILHGVVEPTRAGGLTAVWIPKPGGEPVKFTEADFLDIRSRLSARGIRLGLSIGGEGWMKGGVLAEVAADPVRRAALAGALARFCSANKVSLIDFDWEFPSTRKEETEYGLLIRATRAAASPAGVFITVCVGGAETHGRPHVNDEAVRAADWVHLMAYLPPIEQKTARAAYLEKHVRYWLDVRRIPPEKLLMGIGFYGRQAGPFTTARPRHLAYRKIYDAHRPAPNVEDTGGYWFNGVDTVARQVEYAWREKIGGVFVWECSQDVTTDRPDRVSLQASILRTLSRLRNP